MCWGEWGAAPQWHEPGHQDETLRLWLPDFHALSWDLCTWSLFWGEELERCWESLGSPVLCGSLLLVRLQWGPCLTAGKTGSVGGLKPSIRPWDTVTACETIFGWLEPFHSAWGEESVWCPQWEASGVKDRLVGSLCCPTGHLKATAGGSTSYLDSASPLWISSAFTLPRRSLSPYFPQAISNSQLVYIPLPPRKPVANLVLTSSGLKRITVCHWGKENIPTAAKINLMWKYLPPQKSNKWQSRVAALCTPWPPCRCKGSSSMTSVHHPCMPDRAQGAGAGLAPNLLL